MVIILLIIIAIVDRRVRIDQRTITVDVPKQEVISKDNIPIQVDAVLYYNVQDPKAE